MTDDLAAMPTMHCTIESRSCLPAPPAYQHSLLRHLQHQLRRTSRGKVDNSNLPTTASSRVSSTSEAATTAALLEAAQRQKGFGASSTQAERQEVLQLVAELKEELHTATQADAIDPTQGPVAGVVAGRGRGGRREEGVEVCVDFVYMCVCHVSAHLPPLPHTTTSSSPSPAVRAVAAAVDDRGQRARHSQRPTPGRPCDRHTARH